MAPGQRPEIFAVRMMRIRLSAVDKYIRTFLKLIFPSGIFQYAASAVNDKEQIRLQVFS